MFMKKFLLSVSVAILAGCGTDVSDVEITEIAIADLPADVSALVTAAKAGFQPEDVQKKVRDGRTYYDIEGELPDGTEIEFDVLMTDTGPQIVEIQRDMEIEEIPAAVRDLALEASGNVAPARIIESVQTDGSTIFEFFAPDMPKDPAYEVKWDGGVASVLSERWIH